MTDTLAELERMVVGMSAADKAELDKMLSAELKRKWLPNPGPQTQAYLSAADFILYGGSAGGGKLLSLETPIPTPAGWTTMDDIRVGDTIFGDDGHAVDVIAVSPVRDDAKAYLLTFDDGSRITACSDHLWVTMTDAERETLFRRDPEWKARRRAKRPSRASGNKSEAFMASIAARNAKRAVEVAAMEPSRGSVRTTQEIVDTLIVRGVRRNHSVWVAGAIELPDAFLPIDPYTLGAWLGDGSSSGAGFTGIDPEIWGHFEAAGYRVSHSVKDPQHHHIMGLGKPLASLDLIRNKHVPPVYLRASATQRLALLQGLMDTDGHAALDGGCEFDNTKRRLIDGVYELVVSLGMKATIIEGRAKLNGRDCGAKWRVKFVPDKPVFRLSRKLARQRPQQRRTTKFRYIVDAIEVDPVPMRCIAVNSQSRLYLAGRSFIPTHNTDVILGLALTAHRRSVIFRRAYVDLRGVEERLLEIAGGRQGWNGHDKVYRNNGLLVELGALEAPGAEQSWQGRGHDLIAFDEGAQLSAAKVAFVMGWLRSPDSTQRKRVVIASNPPMGGDGDWLIQWFAPWLDPLYANPAKPGEIRYAITVGTETRWVDDASPVVIEGETYTPLSRTFIPARLDDNPYLRDTGYRAQLQSLPEPLRSQLLHGDFLAGREDHAWQVIPSAWVTLANERWREAEQKRRPMISLAADVALGGGDDTVLQALHADAWFAPPIVRKDADLPDKSQIPAEISTMMLQARRDGADLSVDGTGGWGSGVRSHLVNQHHIECASIVFSAGSHVKTVDGKLGYRNLRAQLYWQFREALDPESGDDVKLPPDPRLMAELTAARYEVRGTDILIEDKAKIKQRVGASPDVADAVVMAWHRRNAAVKKAKPTLPQPRGGGWMGR